MSQSKKTIFAFMGAAIAFAASGPPAFAQSKALYFKGDMVFSECSGDLCSSRALGGDAVIRIPLNSSGSGSVSLKRVFRGFEFTMRFAAYSIGSDYASVTVDIDHAQVPEILRRTWLGNSAVRASASSFEALNELTVRGQPFFANEDTAIIPAVILLAPEVKIEE